MPRIQQAYVYIACAIAIHMVVLGAANVVRVLVELATATPPAAFLGLPFLFAEGSSRPGQTREQISLALALVLIGAPAWYLHWRGAQRAAARSDEDRASPVRSAYLHLVTFVTALLVFFHAHFALSALLGEWLRPAPDPRQLGSVLFAASLAQRVIGPLAMVAVAAIAWAFHTRVANADRRLIAISGAAAAIRRVHTYLLAAIGLFAVLVAATGFLADLWRVAFETPRPVPFEPPRGSLEPRPGPIVVREIATPVGDRLRYSVIEALPTLLVGVALWLAHWRPAQQLAARDDAEGRAELRSAVRKLALYFIAFVSAVTVLVQLSVALVGLLRQALGDPDPGGGETLLAAAGTPLMSVAVFGAAWLLHRRVIAADTARQPELEAQADMRRLYYYLIAAIALVMLAFGGAGLVGVVGSYVMGYQTHRAEEIAGYIALVAVGLPFWAFHWSRNERHIWSGTAAESAAERRSRLRRLFFFVTIGGGALVMLVAGSSALFRILNGLLAQDLGLPVIHDIWHLLVNTATGVAVAAWHWRVLAADRRALAGVPSAPATVAMTSGEASPAEGGTDAAVPRTISFVVTVPEELATATRTRLDELVGTGGRVEPAPTGPQSIAFASAMPLKRVGGRARMLTPPELPRVSYPEGLALQRDISPARWIEVALAGTPWATVRSLVSAGFEAYARVLHPAYRRHGDQRYPSWTPVRWSELAAKSGGTMHRLVQFDRIGGIGTRYDHGPARRPGEASEIAAPLIGSLSFELVAPLVSVLVASTATADTCWFCVWQGSGSLPMLEGQEGLPSVRTPGREYFLVRGAVSAAGLFRTTMFLDGGPNIWWPDDRAWCVATEVDLDSTYVGGSAECIARLLAHPELEAFPAEPGDDVSAASDTLNA